MDGPSWKLCYCNVGAQHQEHSIIGDRVKDLQNASWRTQASFKPSIVWKGWERNSVYEPHGQAAFTDSLIEEVSHLTPYVNLNSGGAMHSTPERSWENKAITVRTLVTMTLLLSGFAAVCQNVFLSDTFFLYGVHSFEKSTFDLFLLLEIYANYSKRPIPVQPKVT